MATRRAKSSAAITTAVIILSILAGTAIWHLLSQFLPTPLQGSFPVGATNGPWNIDLVFIQLSIGFVLRLNLGGALGLILSLVWVARR